MDKIIKNVLIFSTVIVLIAGLFLGIAALKNKEKSSGNLDFENTAAASNYQEATLKVSGSSYVITPSTLKKDVPVRMTVDLNSVNGCARSVVIQQFGVRKYVSSGDNVITFTPTQTGTVNIACSMNMYKGTFSVE